MRKPFLYLDNWYESQPETRLDRYLAQSGLQIETYRTNYGEFPNHSNFCGVYVGPSFDGVYDDLPFVHRLHDLLPQLAKTGMPMIGLCFGCQILASALIAREAVFRRPTHEGGRGTIMLTDAAGQDPLCQALPAKFDVYHWHGDEVRADVVGIEVLADGKGCGNHLWRWSHGPVWGVQPHPEMSCDDLGTWLERNRTSFESKGHDVDGYISQCFTSKPGFTLLERFIERVINENSKPGKFS